MTKALNKDTMKNIALLLVLWAGFWLGCASDESSGPDSGTPSKPSELRIVDLSSNNEQLQADVRAIVEAPWGDAVPTVLKYTHPKIIAAMGGEVQAKSTFETTLAKIRTLTLESFKFPEAPTYLETDRNYYVIVPTLSVMFANDGRRIETLNYQIGMREKEAADWKYVEGSRINQGNVRSLFPDFPSDFEFPEFYRKKI